MREPYFEPDPGAPFDPRELVVSCIESGARSLLLGADVLPSDFFDLSTGVAGELLHHLSKYQLRMAAVVPAPAVHSEHFQDFLYEANRGQQFRFAESRQAALDWLSPVAERQLRKTPRGGIPCE